MMAAGPKRIGNTRSETAPSTMARIEKVLEGLAGAEGVCSDMELLIPRNFEPAYR
jgi:hypothetical protein